MTRPRPSLSPRELADRLARGEPLVIIDVREPRERDFCAIPVPPTAADLHVPMNSVPGRLDELRTAARGRVAVLYCHHGIRSGMVADWLEAHGLTGVLNLEGGIDAWSTTVAATVPRY